MQRRHCIALGLALAIAGGSALAAPARGPVLVLGDSLSAEYGLARGKGWVALLQHRLQAGKERLPVVNASVSGETTAGGRSRLPALLAQHKPSVLVLELGGNDALRGLALQSTQGNLQAMVKTARESGTKVLLVGMQVPPNYGAAYTQQFADMFTQLAAKERLPLVPFLLSGIGDAQDSEQWFQPDRIHPNARAQPQMLENVWPRLKPLLQ
jgi:acyl-CoA thioesterase-1